MSRRADDDLLTRLTTALMDAMGCKDASILGPGNCHRHAGMALLGPYQTGWPCPVATGYAEALLPFVQAEVADALDHANVSVTETLRRIWRGYEETRDAINTAEVLLTQYAEEVRRG